MRVEVRMGGYVPLKGVEEDVVWGEGPKRVGCLIVFSGVVRGYSRDGRRVRKLIVEGEPAQVLEELKGIASEAMSEEGVEGIYLALSLGELNVGEEITRMVVAAFDRETAFRVAKNLIDRVKECKSVRLSEVYG